MLLASLTNDLLVASLAFSYITQNSSFIKLLGVQCKNTYLYMYNHVNLEEILGIFLGNFHIYTLKYVLSLCVRCQI